MFAFAFLLLALVATIDGNSRIIGGQPARVGQFPWQAALYITTSTGEQFCSGTLLSEEWVLTSAFCSLDFRSIVVYLGTISSDRDLEEENRLTTSIFLTVSIGFDLETLANDGCLMKIRSPIQMNDFIQAIPLSTTHIIDGTEVQLAGWGQTSDDEPSPVVQLHYVDLVTISNAECRAIYGDIVSDSKICALGNFNEGSCTGDTGSALVIHGVGNQAFLVGFSSFISSRGCEVPDPSGFTRIESCYDFIQQMINSL